MLKELLLILTLITALWLTGFFLPFVVNLEVKDFTEVFSQQIGASR